MQRRIFIAIEIPEPVKKRLMQKTEKWADLPVRWGRVENLHITLAFLGYLDDEKILGICDSVNNAVKNLEPFEIFLNGIIIGPSENQPRMIWAAGEKSEELKILVEEIEKSLARLDSARLGTFRREKKNFSPHATLGRIMKEKWAKLSEKPEIDEKINFVIPVDKVEIMESVFEEGKRKYLLLESCPFG